jgi:hypothetical protein
MLMKKYIALIVLCTFVLAGFSQRDIPDNLPNFDKKLLHFGFSLGGGSNGFALKPDLTKSDSLIKLEVLSQPGFNVNVVSELHLGPYMGLRFTPGIAFSSRILRYTFYEGNRVANKVIDRTVESTYLDFPLIFKYRSKRVNNFASYVLVGGRYSIDLASQEGVNNQVDDKGEFIVKLGRNNYNLETGAGFDFFLEYFKFSTEFKFCYGLNNVLIQDNTIYSRPITGLNSKIFMIAINFEG